MTGHNQRRLTPNLAKQLDFEIFHANGGVRSHIVFFEQKNEKMASQVAKQIPRAVGVHCAVAVDCVLQAELKEDVRSCSLSNNLHSLWTADCLASAQDVPFWKTILSKENKNFHQCRAWNEVRSNFNKSGHSVKLTGHNRTALVWLSYWGRSTKRHGCAS